MCCWGNQHTKVNQMQFCVSVGYKCRALKHWLELLFTVVISTASVSRSEHSTEMTEICFDHFDGSGQHMYYIDFFFKSKTLLAAFTLVFITDEFKNMMCHFNRVFFKVPSKVFFDLYVICNVVHYLKNADTHTGIAEFNRFASMCCFTAVKAAWQKRQCRIASLATLSLDLAAVQSPAATCIGNQYNLAKLVTWMAVPSSCPHWAATWASTLGSPELRPLFFSCSFQVNVVIFGRISFPSVSVKMHNTCACSSYLHVRAL